MLVQQRVELPNVTDKLLVLLSISRLVLYQMLQPVHQTLESVTFVMVVFDHLSQIGLVPFTEQLPQNLHHRLQGSILELA